MKTVLQTFVAALALAVAMTLPASAQRLISVSPADGATGVSRMEPVTFTFDVDMQPRVHGALGIFWHSDPEPPLLPLHLHAFFYEWTTPKVLKVFPSEFYGGFPKNATISWEFDRYSFFSAAGHPLQAGSVTNGHFKTANQFWGEYRAGAVRLSIEKLAVYEQPSIVSPQISSENPFSFRAAVEADESLGLAKVTISQSGLLGTGQTLDSTSPNHFEFVTWSGSTTGLHAMYPPNYSIVFDLEAPGTLWLYGFSLSATNFPVAPVIANFTAAQTVDASQSFTLRLGQGGAATNKVRIQIRDVETLEPVVETPEWHGESPLPGNATNFVIEAGTLQPGKTYVVEISRWNGTVGTFSGEERTTLAAIGTMTRTQLKTKEGVVPIVLFNPSYTPGSFSVEATLAPNRSYVLERSVDSGPWIPVATLHADSTSTVFSDPEATSNHAIYRVRPE